MSKKAAKLFIEKMSKDESFRERIMAVDNIEDRLAIIHQEGFDVTWEDINSFKMELQDSDLDSFAGGNCNSNSCWLGHGPIGRPAKDPGAPCDYRPPRGRYLRCLGAEKLCLF